MERKQLYLIISCVVIALLALGGLVWWLRARSSAGLEPVTNTQVNTTPIAPSNSGSTTTPTSTKGKVFPSLEDQQKNGQAIQPETASSSAARPGLEDYLGPNPTVSARTTITKTPTTTNSTASSTFTLSPTPSGSSDLDHDGLTRDQELQLGTDPNNPDTDGDGLSDGDEVNKYKTNPLAADTDRDGFSDAEEIKNGYNPLGPGKCANPSCIP